MKNVAKFMIAALLACVALTARAEAIPDECKINGFAVSVQAWSFNRFTVFEAIETVC